MYYTCIDVLLYGLFVILYKISVLASSKEPIEEISHKTPVNGEKNNI